MANAKVKKTEHAGAKDGGGAWTDREDAKRSSRKRRRVADGEETSRGRGGALCDGFWLPEDGEGR